MYIWIANFVLDLLYMPSFAAFFPFYFVIVIIDYRILFFEVVPAS